MRFNPRLDFYIIHLTKNRVPRVTRYLNEDEALNSLVNIRKELLIKYEYVNDTYQNSIGLIGVSYSGITSEFTNVISYDCPSELDTEGEYLFAVSSEINGAKNYPNDTK